MPAFADLSRDLLRDNPPLADKIVAACDLDGQEVPAMLTDVLRFLWLVSTSEDVLTPPERLDRAWHELILFTRTYAALCAQHFGRFLHHQPGGTAADNRAQYHRTLRRYVAAFGYPDLSLWHGDPGCGSCDAQPEI